MKANIKPNYYASLHAALDQLRENNPMGYAQVLMMPFSLIPSYAEEDGPNHEWFSSDEARGRLEMLNEESVDQ